MKILMILKTHTNTKMDYWIKRRERSKYFEIWIVVKCRNRGSTSSSRTSRTISVSLKFSVAAQQMKVPSIIIRGTTKKKKRVEMKRKMNQSFIHSLRCL